MYLRYLLCRESPRALLRAEMHYWAVMDCSCNRSDRAQLGGCIGSAEGSVTRLSVHLQQA